MNLLILKFKIYLSTTFVYDKFLIWVISMLIITITLG